MIYSKRRILLYLLELKRSSPGKEGCNRRCVVMVWAKLTLHSAPVLQTITNKPLSALSDNHHNLADDMETSCAASFQAMPNELLLHILSLISSTVDIFALSSTCRHFHYACLHFLFSKNNCDPFSDEISLLPTNGDSESAQVILEALARSLQVNGTSLKRLRCDLTSNYKSPQSMTREARFLLQYVSKLSHVGNFSLQMMNPCSSEWEAVIVSLLNLLPLKSCKEVELKYMESLIWQTIRSQSTPSPSLLKSAVQSFHSYFPTFNSSVLAKHKLVRVASQTSLEKCHLQHFPPFLQTYYVHLLNTSSNLTNLSVKYVYNSKGWAACLEQIRIPHLSTLSVTHCAVPPHTMACFFARHPSLRSLEFHHNTFIPSHPPRLKGDTLFSVETLVSSPDCIALYLPSPGSLPALQSVRIIAGDRHLGLTRLEGAFQIISECGQDLSLTLEFTSYAPMLDAWLQSGIQQSEDDPEVARPEASTHCVKCLRIDSLDGPFSDLTLNLLPRWLGLFPELRDISFVGRCFRDPALVTKISGEVGFVPSVGKACTSVKAFRLCGGDVEWAYVYPGRT